MLNTSPKDVRVGCILPLTGSMSQLAERCRRGHEIAVEICNEKGGIKSLDNAKVVYEFVDCGDAIEDAVAKCEELIVNKGVSAVTGCYASYLTSPAAEVAEKLKVPFVVSDATRNDLTQRGLRFVFRASATNMVYCKTAIQFGIDFLKARTFGVVYVDHLIGQMLSNDVKKIAKESDIEIMFDRPYDPQTRDFSELITEMKSAKVDLVVGASYVEDAVLMARQMREQNCDIKAFVGMGAGHAIPEFLVRAKKDSEHFASVAYWCHDMQTPRSKELTRRYSTKYRELPIEHPGSCFQASSVLLDAIERAASTEPLEISEALRRADLMTICGRVRFDSSGQNSLAMCVVVQVQNGNFATVWPKHLSLKTPIFPIPSTKKMMK